MAIGIPDYRLPREVLQAEIARIVALGVELRLDTAMGRDFTLGRPRARGLQGDLPRDRRLQEPTARRSGRRRCAGSSRRRCFLKQVNLGEEPAAVAATVVVVGGGSTAMDAARSAWRSGAATVTIVYRRGRADMPAQAEEIEAAEREGIVVRDGLAPDEVVGRDGAVVGRALRRQARARRRSRGRPRRLGADRRQRDPRAPGDRRSSSPIGEEPDPSILPEGAGIEVSGWAGIVADPRTLATGRAGIFAGGDVVSGPKTIIDAVAAGRRAAASIHEYLAGVAGRRGGDPRAPSDTATAPESACSARPRDAAAGPRAAADRRHRLVRGHAGRASTRPTAQAEAGRCFRCDAVYGCPTVEVVGRSRTGGPNRAPSPLPASRSPPTSTPQEARDDTRPGLRLLRRRRGLRRGDDRRRARRPVAARRWRSTSGAAVHGPQHRQVHPAARRGPVVDHLRRAARHHPRSRSSSAASSSSTRTSSPARTCRSPAGSPPSAPSPSC